MVGGWTFQPPKIFSVVNARGCEILADTRVMFVQFWTPRTLEQTQRSTPQRFHSRLTMGRACDTTTNNVLNYPHGYIAMATQIFVAGLNLCATVRVVQMERVKYGGPISRHNHGRSRLYVAVQRTQIARREYVAEFRG